MSSAAVAYIFRADLEIQLKKNLEIMWTTESLWFEIAIVSIIFALGNMIFGPFEERSPRLRKVLKYFLTLIIVITISVAFGRTIAMTLLASLFIPVLYIHGYYLPVKKGINGWTAEPKDRYYDFRGWDKNIFKEKD